MVAAVETTREWRELEGSVRLIRNCRQSRCASFAKNSLRHGRVRVCFDIPVKLAEALRVSLAWDIGKLTTVSQLPPSVVEMEEEGTW